MKDDKTSSKLCMPGQAQNTQPKDESSKSKSADPFDLVRLRLSQDFVSAAGVKKALTTVPVRKPSKEWFIRTHPDPAYRISSCVIELKEDNEIYLVDPSLWEDLISESTFGPRALITSVNRQGVIFLWSIRLPGADGRLDDWNRSALELSDLAAEKWVRVQSNRSLGAYEVFEATGDWQEPKWDLPPFQELLRIAFKESFIDTASHPVLRKLRGEA
ncbi:MAG: hypothetical protein HQ567_20490 [Candidatus Nealsonbacteria bacterium]|nr:hypothetical protein [Candidatus Nealsonbacteria bacterium]